MKYDEQKKFSISEFAKACETTRDTLYHYEKQGLLVPEYDEKNHYRHYSSADFHLFQYIAHLRRMGFSVSDIRDCLRDRNVGTYLNLMKKSRQNCLDEISELQHKYNIITNSLESVSRFSDIPLETPSVQYTEETFFYAQPFTGKFDSLDGIRQFQQHLAIAESLPRITSNITVFRIAERSLEENLTPKLTLMVQAAEEDIDSPEHLHKKPAGLYLKMFFRTDIVSAKPEDLYRFAEVMLQYANEHNYQVLTDFYALVHISTFLTDDPAEYLTEFQLGIE